MQNDRFGRSVERVSRRKLLTTVGGGGTAALAGCLSSESDDGSESEPESDDGDESSDDGLSGEVVVTGSSTAFPISQAMRDRFMAKHPNVTVTVKSTGSGGGFENHFCPGDSDINAASRPIKTAEQDHCTGNGVTPVEMQIAGDALTMAVSTENDWVDCMSFDQLAQIWGEGGAETWADIDSSWPDEPFELYGPDTTSGTYDWFSANVVGDAGHRSDYVGTEDDTTIVQGLEGSPYAMGYFGYGYYAENADRVKALDIKANASDACAEPTLEAAKTGSYPMARPLFIYPSEEALQREVVSEFVRFYLENSTADWIAEEVNYVPSSEEQAGENLSALEEIAGA
ncbi:PstS family phosphate ABC transporter substrate-binding protein [Natrinema sp. 1APR25-10V2]|uniref:PstS family phosphate ABC transporter substrate-binding protein n=1 Tax=Natrinema sp. 1APR25-10V2 TaxID=2951081 RepID=UPI002875A3EA|nr:PstS family phosphate ABC transporter substrate-binding protein [Natrinema sp. 1APR25-10V2]MDS0478538.1 PstS family phosphate ABC transporter substrate-binding protein [Natrinema sp. 1APR25-10V2]